MMHLKFPRNKGFFFWDELGCLGRALGFPANLFHNHIPAECIKDDKGLQTAVFQNMLNVQKYFHKAVDGTFNIHTDEWNLSVINKAVTLLDSRIISFEELHAIRVAFQVYENADTKGMPIDFKLLQRALKMCGRMISTLKMMHRIKHMREHFEEENRIQLHEFLDLLLWCDPYEDSYVQPVELDMNKNEKDLFSLEDFEGLLTHYDERLSSKLDNDYLKQEWKFSRLKYGSKRLPKDVPPVDPNVREKQVKNHKNRYKHLKTEVSQSLGRLQKAHAGYVRDRPIAAPDLEMYLAPIQSQITETDQDSRPQSVYEKFGYLIRPQTSPDSQVLQGSRSEFPRPELSSYQRPQTAMTVTNEDREMARHGMEALKFEMETIEMKYRQMLNEDMDFLLPGYRERIADVPPEKTPCVKKVKVIRDPRPSQETLQRLATPQKHGHLSNTHARLCDARFRGWHNVQHHRGNHFVLVAPSYDTSQKGQLFTKMARSAQEEIQRGDYIFRHTKAEQVAPESALEAQLAKKGLPPTSSLKPDITITKPKSDNQNSCENNMPESKANLKPSPKKKKNGSDGYSDFQMYIETTPDTALLKDTMDSACHYSTITNAQEPPSNRTVAMRQLRKFFVMEEIKEFDESSICLGHKLKLQEAQSPSISSAVDMAILTQSPTPSFECLPATSDSAWIRDVLVGKKKEVDKAKQAKSFKRLSQKAASVGLNTFKNRLMENV